MLADIDALDARLSQVDKEVSDCGKFRRTKKQNEMIHQSVRKKDIMGDKTVRVRADLHHIIKIETAKNGGNVKEVMDQALEEYIRKYLPDKL